MRGICAHVYFLTCVALARPSPAAAPTATLPVNPPSLSRFLGGESDSDEEITPRSGGGRNNSKKQSKISASGSSKKSAYKPKEEWTLQDLRDILRAEGGMHNYTTISIYLFLYIYVQYLFHA